MQPHQERVMVELQELTKNREALVSFINHSSTFPSLPIDEQHRLSKQAYIMEQYEAVLEERIAHFPK